MEELKKQNEEPVVEEAPKKKSKFIYGVVKARLNFRAKPSMNSNVLDILDKDTKVKINLELSNEKWYATSIDSQNGFLLKEFVEIPNNKGEK